jgi:hypothetical protein
VTLGAQLLIFAVIVLAGWLVAHVALWWSLMGVTEITGLHRVYAFLPLLNLYYGWRLGRRWHVGAWALLLLVYVGLRMALASTLVDTPEASP